MSSSSCFLDAFTSEESRRATWLVLCRPRAACRLGTGMGGSNYRCLCSCWLNERSARSPSVYPDSVTRGGASDRPQESTEGQPGAEPHVHASLGGLSGPTPRRLRASIARFSTRDAIPAGLGLNLGEDRS
jgi:hypothetical protein